MFGLSKRLPSSLSKTPIVAGSFLPHGTSISSDGHSHKGKTFPNPSLGCSTNLIFPPSLPPSQEGRTRHIGKTDVQTLPNHKGGGQRVLARVGWRNKRNTSVLCTSWGLRQCQTNWPLKVRLPSSHPAPLKPTLPASTQASSFPPSLISRLKARRLRRRRLVGRWRGGRARDLRREGSRSSFLAGART